MLDSAAAVVVILAELQATVVGCSEEECELEEVVLPDLRLARGQLALHRMAKYPAVMRRAVI